MKMQVLKFGLRKVMLVAGFVSVLSLSSMAAVRSNGKNNAAAQSSIEYAGTTANGIVFNVKYDNAEAAKFDLVIKNEYGDIVFQQTYSDKNFDKKVMLVKEPGDAHLTFIIKGAGADYKQAFDITTSTRTVEDVVVKNVK